MRARNIKPAFFINEDLADVSYQARLLFIGLWCYADRDGLFEWREKRIKAAIFPYDNVDIVKLLMSLHEMSFIHKYKYDGKEYGCILGFSDHQNPHPHEAKSKIKKPELNQCHGEQVTLREMSTKCNADLRNPDIRIDDIRIQTVAPEDEIIKIGSHVKIKRKQLDQLNIMLGDDCAYYIETVNDYCAAKGKSYKDYSAAVRNFWRRDGGNKRPPGKGPNGPVTFEAQRMNNTKSAIACFLNGGKNDDTGHAAICSTDG